MSISKRNPTYSLPSSDQERNPTKVTWRSGIGVKYPWLIRRGNNESIRLTDVQIAALAMLVKDKV